MSSNPPPAFDEASYIAWHEREIPADTGLLAKLADLRKALVARAPEPFEQLGQLLTHIQRSARAEARLQTKLLPSNFGLPTEALRDPTSVETTFKSVPSIVEKLWRKNRSGPKVMLSNMEDEITDLVRVSVVAPTLFHAKVFSERLRIWDELISGSERTTYLSRVARVEVDDEAKVASGYFAQHALVRFSDGFIVEVQIYSELAAAWRALSHHAYERARIGLDARARFGEASTRLVSLGHLLHLAECELERIAKDFKQ